MVTTTTQSPNDTVTKSKTTTIGLNDYVTPATSLLPTPTPHSNNNNNNNNNQQQHKQEHLTTTYMTTTINDNDKNMNNMNENLIITSTQQNGITKSNNNNNNNNNDNMNHTVNHRETHDPLSSIQQVQVKQPQHLLILTGGIGEIVNVPNRLSTPPPPPTLPETNNLLPSSPQQQPPPPILSWYIIEMTFVASIGGILFGYDLGVISSALPQLIQEFHLQPYQQEYVVSILYMGGCFGAMMGGSLCDQFGRKRTIIGTDFIFFIGALIMFYATHYYHLLLGRIVIGMGVAISGIADVSYLHEIAPIHVRGAIVSVNEACISLGFLFAFGAGTYYEQNHPNDGWRYMFGISGIFAIIQFIGMLRLPESPKWLLEQQQHQQQGHSSSEQQVTTQFINVVEKNKMTTTTTTTIKKRNTSIGSSSPNTNDTNEKITYQSSGGGGGLVDNNNQQDDELLTRSTSFVFLTSDGGESSNHKNNNYYYNNTTTTSVTSVLSSTCFFCTRWISNSWYQIKNICYSCYTFMKILIKYYQKQSCITLFLVITQQLCGQTNVISYAPLIFAAIATKQQQNSNNNDTEEEINNEDQQQHQVDWSTLSIGIVKFIVTVIVIFRIETFGRRFLLLSGMFTICIGLFFLCISFSINNNNNYNNNNELDDNNNNNDFASSATSGGVEYLALPGVLLVVTGYSMSFGPLTWLLTSELFPTEIRGRALGASTIITYLVASFITYTFLSAQEWIGSSAVFGIYLITTLVGILFAYHAIPDTGEKNTEEIAEELNEMPFWRRWCAATITDDTQGLYMSSPSYPPSNEIT